jgi:hypothetical protein
MERHSLFLKAMEKETEDGIFDPAMWAGTFPKKTAEMLELRRAMLATALADKLPPVLIGVVVPYIV